MSRMAFLVRSIVYTVIASAASCRSNTVRADALLPASTLESTAIALNVSAFGRNVFLSARNPLLKSGKAKSSAPNPVMPKMRPVIVAGTAAREIHEVRSSPPALMLRMSMV